MDPGTALAIVSLGLQVFDGCVKAFTLLSESSSFGDDASLHQTLLTLEEHRFLGWAHAVKLHEKPWQPDPALNQQLAAELMGHLELLLRPDTLKKRYKFEILDRKPSDAQDQSREGNLDGSSKITATIFSNPAVRKATRHLMERSKSIHAGNSLAKRIWWAAADRDRFQDLIQNVRDIVDGLWKLLDPITRRDTNDMLVRQLETVIQVSKDATELLALQRALAGSQGNQLSYRDESSNICGNISLNMLAQLRISKVDAVDIENGKLDVKAVANPESLPAIPKSNPSVKVLQAELLSDTRKLGSEDISLGRYEGAPVLIETKKVDRRMKAKLILRVKALAQLLSNPIIESLSTLRCLGYIEKTDEFMLVFEYPEIKCSHEDKPCPAATQDPVSLLDIIRGTAQAKPLPSVTTRVDMALRISRVLLALHIAGWLHKDIRSGNMLFFPTCEAGRAQEKQAEQQHSLLRLLDPRFAHFRLVGFTFSREDHPIAISEQPSANPARDIYRHPDALGEPAVSFAKHMDRYMLGTVLIELAMWQQLRHVVYKCVKVPSSGGDVPLEGIAKVKHWIGQNVVPGEIRYRMGNLYSSVIEACISDQSDTYVDSESHTNDNDLDEVEVLRQMVKRLGRIEI
ncbi:prion-inhibition and propagation-domain-containing protein [Xylariaceae sp. FL0016]|nr:prion-inhibition and propagation-domain-containing protein [Xylariaceae sp. FL0016]